ncbi:MAG: toll/interleukin-1 receptor domain-containing protein [Magnetococcus sp. YQC-5]
MNMTSGTYDVALSFAGEDRIVAQALADALVKNFTVFYDKYEASELWGRDLTVELPLRFQNSRFCIMLISKPYLEKMWTNFERQEIISKFLKLRGTDYLLPVRLNGFNEKLPGLADIVMYLDIDAQNNMQNFIEIANETLAKRLMVAQTSR